MIIIGKRELLNPKIDYTFKRIFGFIGNEEITKGLISAILEDVEIKEIELDCKEILEKDLVDEKLGILDIKVKLNNEVQCNIEMQMIDKKNTEDRIMYYWSKMYSQSIKKGENYSKTKRTIVILFANYEIKNLTEIKKYISKWHIREDEYRNYILTNKLEIVIIEIPKYRRYAGKNRKLDAWVKFIDKPEEIDMGDIKNNKALEEAKKLLEDISEDERERELQWKRELALMDKQVIEQTGYERGKEEGIEQGITEGIAQNKIEIAKNALEAGIELEIIEKITGLTKEEIEKLK